MGCVIFMDVVECLASASFKALNYPENCKYYISLKHIEVYGKSSSKNSRKHSNEIYDPIIF